MKFTKINKYKYALMGLAGLAFAGNLSAATLFSNGFEDVDVPTGSYTYTDGPTWSKGGAKTWYYSTGYNSGTYTPPSEGSNAAQVRDGGIQASAGHTFVAGTTYRISAMTSTNGTWENRRTIMLGDQSLGDNAIDTTNAFAFMTVEHDGMVSASSNADNQVTADFTGTWQTLSFEYTATAADDGKTIGIALSGGSNADLVTLETVAVPEPSSAALLGLAGIALILRRRK